VKVVVTNSIDKIVKKIEIINPISFIII
jgi:hypothetical protein